MKSTSTHITLGPLDHISPWNIPQSVVYLSLKHGVKARDAFLHLQEGLRRTIAQLPWLNGRVHWQSENTPGWRPGLLEIRSELLSEGPPHQLRFNNLDTDLTFADLRVLAFPLDTFNDETLLWKSPFEPNFEEGAEVLMAQANFLPGGCALVLSVAPPASDGTAMLSVTRIWADHCRSIVENEGQGNGALSARDPDSNCERTSLDVICGAEKYRKTPSQILPEICHLAGLDPGQAFVENSSIVNDATTDIPNKMTPSLFYLPQTAYTALRKECAAQLGTTEITGNDLICALIWRSVVRAWNAVQMAQQNNAGLAETISEVAIPFDARPDFMDSLPASFLGNLNFENRLALPLNRLLADDMGIPELAKAIRTHAQSFGSVANMQDAYRLLNSVPDYTRLPQMRAPRMKSASVGILSPMMLPFNEACFGSQTFGNGGRPEAFRPLMGERNSGFRTCFVMPRKPHGGIEFVMTLSKEEMDFLGKDDEFTTYVLHMA